MHSELSIEKFVSDLQFEFIFMPGFQIVLNIKYCNSVKLQVVGSKFYRISRETNRQKEGGSVKGVRCLALAPFMRTLTSNAADAQALPLSNYYLKLWRAFLNIPLVSV